MPSKKPILTIRTTEKLIERLRTASERQNRSISNMGETIIKEYLDNYEVEQERGVKKEKETKPENINVNKSKGVVAGDNNGTIEVK